MLKVSNNNSLVIKQKDESQIRSYKKTKPAPDTHTYACTRTEQCLKCFKVGYTNTKKYNLMLFC